MSVISIMFNNGGFIIVFFKLYVTYIFLLSKYQTVPVSRLVYEQHTNTIKYKVTTIITNK